MADSTWTRRGFLTSAGSAAAAAVWAQLAGARWLDAHSQPPAGQAFSHLAEAYSLDDGLVYLNHASIGTIPRVVQTARRRYLEICEGNPWLYIWGGEWEGPREEVRAQAARTMGCAAQEVALTHNTTEAFNLLARGLPLGPGDEILFSSLNHSGASVAWQLGAAMHGYSVRTFEVPLRDIPAYTPDDVVQLYSRQIHDRTAVLVFPHIDNIVGLRHPVRRLTAAARSRGVRYIAVDGAQSIGMIPVDTASLGVDAYATSPHKWLQAPKGLGLLYVAREMLKEVRPLWVTWGQKRWAGSARIFEDYGTRNLPEVLALGDAISFQERLGEDTKVSHYRRLRHYAQQAVDARPQLSWQSPASWEMGASLFSIGLRDARAADVARRLFAEDQIVVRPFSVEGLEFLRVSPNALNRAADIDRLLAAL